MVNDNESIGTEIQVKDQNDRTATYISIPDVAVIGDVINNYGDVIIENRQGNIAIGSGSAKKSVNVNGRMVQMIAEHGSISQDFIDDIVSIGGRPQDMNRDLVEKVIAEANISGDDKVSKLGLDPIKTNIETPEAGRIAGDSVYLAAADINVNGLIQSGYSRYIAEIDEYVKDEAGNYVLDSDNNRIKALSDKHIQMLKSNGSEVTVQGRTMYRVNDGNRVVFDQEKGAFKYIVQVYYDPLTKGLVVEDIDTKGGRIYLTGRISSTGNGRILAVNGGADIAITNHTKANLTTGRILNNDIEGRITITDLAKDTWTEYSRSGTVTIDEYSKRLRESADLEQYKAVVDDTITWFDKDHAKTYDPKTGLRYNWTLGQEKTKTSYYEKVTKTLFWGGLVIDKDTDQLEAQEDNSTLVELPKVEDGRSLGNGTFVDTISEGYQDENGTRLVDTEFGGILESNKTATSREVTDSYKEGGHWYALWSDPKYHTKWGSVDPGLYILPESG